MQVRTWGRNCIQGRTLLANILRDIQCITLRHRNFYYYRILLQLYTFISNAVKHILILFRACFSTVIPNYIDTLGQDDLGRRSQRTKAGELVLRQVISTAECGQHCKRSASCSLRYGDLSAVGAAASHLSVRDVGDHIDQTNVEWCVRVDLDEECRWVICKLQWSSSRRWWLQVWWWHWRFQGKLWQDCKRKLLRARDDEHLGEVVGVHSSQGSVEGCGER